MKPVIRPRLNIRRQELVSQAIAGALAVNRPTPIVAATRTRAEVVVAIGQELKAFTNVTPKRLNNVTMGVVVAIESILEIKERVLSEKLVPRDAAQAQSLDRVNLLQSKLLPEGTGFIRKPMGLFRGVLTKMVEAAEEPEVEAAIEAEGLAPCIAKLKSYAALYTKSVGPDLVHARAGEEDACNRWNDAYDKFAAQVTIDYENDQAMRDELLGPYDSHLEEQRVEARARRAARLKAAQDDGEAPAPTAPAPAPTAPAPEPPPESPSAEAEVAPRSAA